MAKMGTLSSQKVPVRDQVHGPNPDLWHLCVNVDVFTYLITVNVAACEELTNEIEGAGVYKSRW